MRRILQLPLLLMIALPFSAIAQKGKKMTSNVVASDSAQLKTGFTSPNGTSAASSATGGTTKPPTGGTTKSPAKKGAVNGTASLSLSANDSLFIEILAEMLDLRSKFQQIQAGPATKEKPKPKEVVFGYFLFKDPGSVITYDDKLMQLPNPNLSKNNESTLKKVNDNLKTNGGDALPKEVQFDQIQIDSLLIKTSRQKVVRIVVFAEGVPYPCTKDIDLKDVNAGTTALSFYRAARSQQVFIKLIDLLSYVPQEDDDKNFVPIDDFLTPASKKLNLIKQ